MRKKKCNQELYTTFIRVTSERYSSLSLSEVSPIEISHDTISKWLRETKCQPKEIWEEVKEEVKGKRGYLIVDETIINKNQSKKIYPLH